LILALGKGAVEAQVSAVPNGEAFAVDVEGARVAVHGTHLRVERQGGRAIVDLREGVVSIGVPPKSGATYGDLVTAPAHVEFDAADPHGTLKVTHEVYRVRTAQVLERTERAAAAPIAVAPPMVGALTPEAGSPAPIAALAPTVPHALVPPITAATGAAAVTAPVPAPATPARADTDPEQKIAQAVKACARKHLEKSDGVVITVSSRLELRVGDRGIVESARFDPPLAPEVQQCAANTIYGVKFASPGAVTVPLDFKR
jgi:hypothetical protein